jgi:hypothetical protein
VYGPASDAKGLPAARQYAKSYFPCELLGSARALLRYVSLKDFFHGLGPFIREQVASSFVRYIWFLGVAFRRYRDAPAPSLYSHFFLICSERYIPITQVQVPVGHESMCFLFLFVSLSFFFFVSSILFQFLYFSFLVYFVYLYIFFSIWYIFQFLLPLYSSPYDISIHFCSILFSSR